MWTGGWVTSVPPPWPLLVVVKIAGDILVDQREVRHVSAPRDGQCAVGIRITGQLRPAQLGPRQGFADDTYG